MATRGTGVRAARQTARLGVEGVAAGILTVGAATPIVAPLCVALLKAKEAVDGASRNKEELEELLKLCKIITEKVIDKAEALRTSIIDVSLLQKHVHDLNKVASRCRDQGRFAKRMHFRTNGEEIQRLRARIRDIVPIMTLELGMDLSVRLPSCSMTDRTSGSGTISSQLLKGGGHEHFNSSFPFHSFSVFIMPHPNF